MSRKLRADEIECRVAQVSEKGCSLLLYKTARTDRAILDEEFGPMNWQNDFKVIDGKMYGGIGVRDEHAPGWVWKWDCGTESNTEAEKGQASDCFKRAGFKWGIGIELYSAPFIWILTPTIKNEYASKKAGKDVYQLADKYAKFEVKSISYADNGDINGLSIMDKSGNEVFNMNKKVIPPKPPEKIIPPKPEKVSTEVLKEVLKTVKTVDYLNKIWMMYKDKAADVEAFKNLCADKKAEITKGTENE